MIEIQLYIEKTSGVGDFVRLDLFEGEAISLTSSIQDVKDLAKILADFSRSFKIPANDTNNKFFQHFYNPDIDGYDANLKRNAKIFLNHQLHREGFAYLDSVELKNQKSASYNITFYGGIIILKDKIRDYKLSSLDLSSYNHDFNATEIKTGFQTGLHSGNVIYPLITPKKRLYYDSSSTSPDYDGNIYYSGTTNTKRGVAYTDLKPAIKVQRVLEAIETKFGISFDGFFDTTPMDNLYLWLSRASGNIIDYKGIQEEIIKVTRLTPMSTSQSNAYPLTVTSAGVWSFSMFGFQNETYKSIVNLTNISSTTAKITVRAVDLKTGDAIAEQEFTGSTTATFDTGFIYAYNWFRSYDIVWEVVSDASVTFNSTVTVESYLRAGGFGFGGGTATGSVAYDVNSGNTLTTAATMELSNHLPDMKIIDFLTGLFRMFNLTAYVKSPIASTPVIEVQTLDAYYADAVNNMTGGTIDITDFVDVESHEVEPARPFTKISFKYQETDTVMMKEHQSSHLEIFGNAEYVQSEYSDIGTTYEIQLPFSHLKYERLYDVSDNSLTYIQWGYAAGGDFKHEELDSPAAPRGDFSSKDIKPLLFYGINQTITGGEGINWIGDGTGNAVELSTYWRPSNANEEGSLTTAPAYNLNFDSEFDEWQRIDYRDFDSSGNSLDNSLFSTYYRNYIQGVYNRKKRLYKYKCFLPAKVLTRYKLNDQIKIHDRIFHINSITTNLNTGKTELELLNLIPNVDTII